MRKLFEFKSNIGTPYLDPNSAKLPINRNVPIVIGIEYSNTEIKLGEAKFFLDLIEQNASCQAIIYYGLSAFLSAARTLTLFLQKEGKRKKGFDLWYNLKQNELKEDSLAKFFHDTRNDSNHKFYTKIKTIFRIPCLVDSSGQPRINVNGNYGCKFEFIDYLFEDGLNKCKIFISKLEVIIKEANDKGFLSKQNKRNVSIESLLPKEVKDGNFKMKIENR